MGEFVTQLDGTGMKRLHRAWRKRTTNRVALILDGVANPFNVGSIVRTAAAQRVDNLWIAAGTSPEHNKVDKTALGSARYLSWTEVESGSAAVTAARANGFRVVALELTSDASPLHETDLAGDIALVIGHEDRGVHQDTLMACDAVAFIPQLGKVGSLNVAIASAIALHETRRADWTK
ncbi:MAG: TrmH family RNA methyltransferase [Acidimicrobiia bacterium]|nr:TrmH family RNA methyltransferase [Acidimicrobiia bacterium]